MTWLQGLTPIDYVIIGTVVGALLLGWVRGFVEVLSGFLVFLVATFIAGQYTDTVLAMLNRMWNLQERFAGVFDNEDIPTYRLAQEVLRGEHGWLEGGIVGR